MENNLISKIKIIKNNCKTNNDLNFDVKHEQFINNINKNYTNDDDNENYCVICGEPMGPNNPRQLCGKTICFND